VETAAVGEEERRWGGEVEGEVGRHGAWSACAGGELGWPGSPGGGVGGRWWELKWGGEV
jgi:hypothetical protein